MNRPSFKVPGAIFRESTTRRQAAGTSVSARAAAVVLRAAAVALTAAAAMLPAACASTGSVPAPDAAFSGGAQPAADEVRAVWVVRHSLSSPAAAREVVAQAAAGGFNTLIVQVRGRADALYRSALEPRPEFLTGQPEFDPLQLVLEEARTRGLTVHAWVNAYLVWGPVDPPLHPGHLVKRPPRVAGGAACVGTRTVPCRSARPGLRAAAHRLFRRQHRRGGGTVCESLPPWRAGAPARGVERSGGRPMTWTASTTTTSASPPRRSTIRARRWNGFRRG